MFHEIRTIEILKQNYGWEYNETVNKLITHFDHVHSRLDSNIRSVKEEDIQNIYFFKKPEDDILYYHIDEGSIIINKGKIKLNSFRQHKDLKKNPEIYIECKHCIRNKIQKNRTKDRS